MKMPTVLILLVCFVLTIPINGEQDNNYTSSPGIYVD